MNLKHKLFLAVLLAGTLTAKNVLADDQTLPLTPSEIAKLQHVFRASSNRDVNFQDGPQCEHVVWQQTPIDVTLPIGKERMLSFSGQVSFGYDKNALGDNILGVQNNNGTLYLTAKSAFTTQRVEVKCSDSGQIVLLNLSAQDNASDTPLDVIMASNSASLPSPTASSPASSEQSEQNNSATSSPYTNNTVSYVELTRFAAQQLYAPKRLLIQPPNIYRTPMHTAKTVPLLLDGSVIAMPLASWRGGDLTVTAVLLRNQLHQANTLDPRTLCGSWQAATFFPQTVLAPAGQRQDSTTVFLIANRAFSDAMQTCLRGF